MMQEDGPEGHGPRDGPLWAMGLMCGTSMDGVDAALIETDGHRVTGFGPTLALSPAYNARARRLLAETGTAIADALESGGAPDPVLLAEADATVDAIHLAAVTALAARSDRAPDIVGYHGQTLFHAPERGLTHQAGNGAWLAAAAGLPVLWDFRSADIAAGGEGAPLAPFFHWALARHIGAETPVAFLNIGGVANVTWVDPAAEAPEAPGALVAFDTGPGNALIDDWVSARAGVAHDAGGGLAGAGTVHARLLASNAAAAYIARRGPKSLDRNAFQAVLAAVEPLSAQDGAATLTGFTADCVAAALAHLPAPPTRWLVCGGGRNNTTMMAMLASRLHAPVDPVEAVGLDGDMLEAQAFAYLAVRGLRGLALSAPGTTGCGVPTGGGQISSPPPAPRPRAGGGHDARKGRAGCQGG